MKNTPWFLIGLLLLAGSGCATGPAPASMVLPAAFKWVDTPRPGFQFGVLEGDPTKASPFTLRVKFPPNFQEPPHYHSYTQYVTVISGTYYSGRGDKFDMEKGDALPAGSFMVMPIDTRHYAWTKEETVIQIHGVGPTGTTYVNPADDPRNRK
jgi:quercetin dioxygenase-like cupin family protein